jgi:hypothetical protein
MMSELVKFFNDVSGLSRFEKEEVRHLRDQRKEMIKTMGGPPLRRSTAFDPVFELAMQEAEIREFEYDLCVVPERTYKSLHDISATVPVPGKHYGKMPDFITEYDLERMDDMSPPTQYSAGEYTIQMTYSEEIHRAILLNTGEL